MVGVGAGAGDEGDRLRVWLRAEMWAKKLIKLLGADNSVQKLGPESLLKFWLAAVFEKNLM